jgi:hypothetical protein
MAEIYRELSEKAAQRLTQTWCPEALHLPVVLEDAQGTGHTSGSNIAPDSSLEQDSGTRGI